MLIQQLSEEDRNSLTVLYALGDFLRRRQVPFPFVLINIFLYQSMYRSPAFLTRNFSLGQTFIIGDFGIKIGILSLFSTISTLDELRRILCKKFYH